MQINVPTNFKNLKSKLYRLDVDKLVLAPVDLSKLSNVVKNDVKKDVYNAKIRPIIVNYSFIVTRPPCKNLHQNNT